MEDKNSLRQQIERRLSALTTERQSFLTYWKEISDFISPRTSRYFVTDRNKGNRVNTSILDETATLAWRTFKSGMMAGTSSPSRPWFRLAPYDPGMAEFASVKQWLFHVESLMREVIARSNFYKCVPMVYGSLGAYATAAMIVLEDEDEVFRCYPQPVGSYSLGANSRLQVDTFFREFSMTVKQLVEWFGIDNVSRTVKDLYEKGTYDAWIEVVHVIEPNMERQPGKLDSRNKPFREVYFEKGCKEKEFLREMGYDEFPVVAPRWELNGEDVYGCNSPAMVALGSVKGLQVETKHKLRAINTLADPPLLIDSIVQNQNFSRLPGAQNYVPNLASQSGARPLYDINPRIDHLMQDIQEVQMRINRAFYVDVLQMFMAGDTPQMTEDEVAERAQERLWSLGPVMEQMNDELYDPFIDRVFNIMLRRGMFPEPPEELQGQNLRVEYISIMAQAQKIIGVSSIERTARFIGGLAEAMPDVLDKFDADQAIDEYSNMTGVPPRVIRTDDQVAEIRANRAQAKQMEQMAMAAQPLQQAAQGAKLLSETNISDANALTRMLGIQ